MKYAHLIIGTIASVVVFSGTALAEEACDPTKFVEHLNQISNVEQALMVDRLEQQSQSENKTANQNANVGYGGFTVGGGTNNTDQSNSNALSRFQLVSRYAIDQQTAASYISSMYGECLIYNANGVKIHIQSGDPNQTGFVFSVDYVGPPGLSQKVHFRYDPWGFATVSNLQKEPFIGRAIDSVTASGRNIEKPSGMNVAVIGADGALIATANVAINPRVHVFGPKPIAHKIKYKIDAYKASSGKGNGNADNSAIYYAPPDSIITGHEGDAYSCACDNFDTRTISISDDKKSAKVFLHESSASAGADHGAHWDFDFDITTTQIADITDDLPAASYVPKTSKK
jgi:hypothetical protein